ncbi:MAG: nicotinate (nicotinamide) nucleotide adenylyltransferase [Clostridiales bacterium]|nr:nicotinate (nicotinamide) nucleotide adenylyltransferase [Clostridiales bacterium]
MRIGIFGGAFNPVHNGHINLIEAQKRFMQLDKIIIVPTAFPPHKSSENLASADDRINMLSLVIHNKDNFSVDITDSLEISDIEFKRKGKSYTYYTLKAIRKLYPSDDLFLLIGSDQFLSFKNWYRYKSILKMASVVAIVRENNERESVRKYLEENQKEFFYNCAVCVCKPVVVSSSEIREKIKKNEDISALVPAEVSEYVKDKGLYIV